MKILWLAWKDKHHPAAGGAEVVLHELSQRLVQDGHEVTILTARYPGSAEEETLDGVHIIRKGSNRYLHSFQALAYYLRHLRHTYDEVIETVNTAPYFAVLFKNNGKRPALFYHQLARKIWFYETPLAVSLAGYYVLEPFSTFVLGRARAKTLTVSNSTKQDLMRFGFHHNGIHIINQGIYLPPADDLQRIQKYDRPTVLSLGAARIMKRTIDQIKAFELAKRQMPDLQMKLAGDHSGEYGQKVLDYIAASPYSDDIEHLGRVSTEEKIELMQRCHLITVTSVKEGWGLIVTEAASQGTPAVAYDIDGLRDSVRHNETGIITAANPAALSDGIVTLLKQPAVYEQMRQTGWEWSKRFNFDQSYRDFMNILEQA